MKSTHITMRCVACLAIQFLVSSFHFFPLFFCSLFNSVVLAFCSGLLLYGFITFGCRFGLAPKSQVVRLTTLAGLAGAVGWEGAGTQGGPGGGALIANRPKVHESQDLLSLELPALLLPRPRHRFAARPPARHH